MTDWIPLSIAPQTATSTKSPELNVKVFVSPYDVPEAVRGFFDQLKDRFVIEFKYIGTEPTSLRSSEPHIDLRIGENSGRLYGLELDMKALKTESVSLQVGVGKIKHAIEALIKSPEQHSRLDNYLLVQQALHSAQDKLLRTAAAAG